MSPMINVIGKKRLMRSGKTNIVKKRKSDVECIYKNRSIDYSLYTYLIFVVE